MPLYILYSLFFLHITFRYVIPSRASLVDKLIPNSRNKITEKLKGMMEKSNFITLSTVIRTNRKIASFLGITAHFIKDWELKSCALVCKYVY